MIEFRDYQQDIIRRGSDILRSHWLLYLAMEVRTGKTLTALGICSAVGARTVLFITKKKAMPSIESDYYALDPSFELTCINYESLHKIEGGFDIVICDEAHSIGKFPKPSQRAKRVKEVIARQKCAVILMSGTPTPESYSQMYHQVYGIPNNPFRRYKNFYKFCADHVNVKERIINGMRQRDYKDGKDSILRAMTPYTIRFSQRDAGFQSRIDEEILEVGMSEVTYSLAKRLKKDLVVEGKEQVILGDTPAKLMQKLHQIYSGTVKFESGDSMVLDDTKAQFIREHFKGKKIGIFYKFKAELKMLKEAFGDDLTTDIDVFNSSDKSIALQIVSGREGISLRKAESLVYINIDFSATSYWQSRDRMTTKDSKHNTIYWVFAKKGIEKRIYKAVKDKKNYTTSHFKRDLLNL